MCRTSGVPASGRESGRVVWHVACGLWHVTLLAGRLLLDLIDPFLGVLPKHQRVRRAARARLLLLFIRVCVRQTHHVCVLCV